MKNKKSAVPPRRTRALAGAAVLAFAVLSSRMSEKAFAETASPASQQAARSDAQAELRDRMVPEQVEKIQRENLESTALYWSWRIHIEKDVTYEELHDYSNDWIMRLKTRDALFAAIKKLIDSGKTRTLTPAELAREDAVTNQIRKALGRGPLGSRN